MLSRYSVKKPYTVVVAVILVLILGVVSFTKMNTDLLPSMDMPYAMVYDYLSRRQSGNGGTGRYQAY